MITAVKFKQPVFLFLKEVIAIANQRRITSPASAYTTPTPSVTVGVDRHGPPTPHFTRIGTIMSSAPGTRAATAVSGLTDETVIGDIFGHYCSLIYQAVLDSVVSSLLLIGDCVKPLGRMPSGIKVKNGIKDRYRSIFHCFFL